MKPRNRNFTRPTIHCYHTLCAFDWSHDPSVVSMKSSSRELRCCGIGASHREIMANSRCCQCMESKLCTRILIWVLIPVMWALQVKYNILATILNCLLPTFPYNRSIHLTRFLFYTKIFNKEVVRSLQYSGRGSERTASLRIIFRRLRAVGVEMER